MTVETTEPAASPPSGRFDWAGYALGFGLGGFFDGILLHQVLQWHHLLSGIEEARRDIRVLIMTDGLFHVLMYVVTAAGLWLLWRARRDHRLPGADRRLFANALVGFGAWHVLDGILSHWVLGIHRIRMDVDTPLFWDLLWFVLFGLVPLIVGWLMRRSGGDGDRAPRAPVALALAALVAGPLAALPPPQDDMVMILFRPGVPPADALAAIAEAEGRFVWSDPSEQVFAVDFSAGGNTGVLYRRGALLVGNSILPAGCFDWIRA